jgi:diaminopimelate epimerase
MRVAKYNGCGNDFVVIDANQDLDYGQLAQELCQDPRFDTDGLIAVKQEPLEMIFYNRDGSRAPMCGNGVRCLAKYCYDQGIVCAGEFDVQTLAGTRHIRITDTNPFRCTVDMGEPLYDRNLLKLTDFQPLLNRPLTLPDGQEAIVNSVFLGTIHTVVFVNDAEAELSLTRGHDICHHPVFGDCTNVNFVQILADQSLVVRTYERGVGWTKACGTGCSAAYVIARDLGHIPTQATTVHLETGQLTISGRDTIMMSGPAVFEKMENV